jgi:hypothetical protein
MIIYIFYAFAHDFINYRNRFRHKYPQLHKKYALLNTMKMDKFYIIMANKAH